MTVTILEPTVAPAVTEADVLRRAADLLEEFGWCQGDYAKPANGLGPAGLSDPCDQTVQAFCMAGAYYRAACDLGRSVTHPGDCEKQLRHLVPDQWRGSISLWNDESTRTKAEVVQRLREAAEAAS